MTELVEKGKNIDPAYGAFQIYPSDTQRFARPIRAFYVGVEGNVCLVTLNGETVTLMNVTAGIIYPIMCIQIRTSGTTAESLVGLY